MSPSLRPHSTFTFPLSQSDNDMRMTRGMVRRAHEVQQHSERSSAFTKRRAKVVSKVTRVDCEPWTAKSVTSFANLDSTEDADRSRSTSRSEAYDQESASSVAISGEASTGGDEPVMPVFASYGLISSMGTTNSLIGSIRLVPVTVAGWEGQLGIVFPWSQTPTLLCNLKTLMSHSDWIPLRHGLDDDLEGAFYTPGQTVLGNVSGLSKHISFMAMWTNPSYTRAMSLCRDLKTGARAEAQPWIVQMLFFGEPTYGVDESLQSIKHDRIRPEYRCERGELYSAVWAAIGALADDPQCDFVQHRTRGDWQPSQPTIPGFVSETHRWTRFGWWSRPV